MPANWTAPPDWTVALALFAAAVFGTIGHWFVIAAHRAAPPLVIAPFQYTQLAWMVAFGYVAFGDLPHGHVLLGALFIIASGLYALYRESVRRRG
jgi:drug/metabolite transporter (DMT)-like permease